MIRTSPSGKVAHTSATTFPTQQDIMERMNGDPNFTNAPMVEPRVSLAQVLTYVNTAVVSKIGNKLNLSPEDAQQLFEDTLRFLWLSGMFGNVQPTVKIDEAWHLFILFTRDYRDFCQHFFGHFLDHRPHYPTDLPDDGSTLVRTRMLVTKYLGNELSANWAEEAGCGGCVSKCKDRCRCQ